MNIEETTLWVGGVLWGESHPRVNDHDEIKQLKRFAHVLLAELSKDAEPVCWMTPDGEGWRMRTEPPIEDTKLGWTPLFTSPPNTADIEQRVAEAIAKMADDKDVERTDYCMHVYEEGEQYKSDLIAGIKAGKWREYL